MSLFEMKIGAQRLLSIGSACVLLMALTGCETLEDRRRHERHEDARKCSSYGAREGSRAFSDCMYRRQLRRDRDRDWDRREDRDD